MLQFEELRLELNDNKQKLSELREALGLDALKEEIAKLEEQTAAEEFWGDIENSQKVLQRISQLKNKVANYTSLETAFDDTMTLIELADEEEDLSMFDECREGVTKFEDELEKQTLSTLLNGEYDAKNALLTFHAGAGGTEAQDWTQMLVRMYQHWGEKHDFKVSMLDFLDGDEAGLKSAVLLVEGENAYGYLKGEMGVHRLVRVSPFDSSGRRHTSFASLEVMPEIDDNIEVEINPDDLKVDTYRASGAGGQHINKTDSAIRITHLPTGMVVECQDERSQFKNKDKALRVLRARLFEQEKTARDAAYAADRKAQVGTGDRSERIRTYNFPQGRVTDHRIGLTLYRIDSILDGDLSEIVDALHAADRAAKLQAQEKET